MTSKIRIFNQQLLKDLHLALTGLKPIEVISLIIYSLIVLVVMIYYYVTEPDKRNLPQTLLMIFVGFSSLLAMRSFYATQAWNRKNAALDIIWKTREPLYKCIEVLNAEFNYSYRPKDEPITGDEVHKKACIDSKDGYAKDKNGIMVVNKEKQYILDNLRDYLNILDYIASGVENNAFDEKTINDTYEGIMMNANRLLKPYIEHMNFEMYNCNKIEIWDMIYNYEKRIALDIDYQKPEVNKNGE